MRFDILKDKTRLTSYDSLPLVLDVTHIQQIMGISRVRAYELVHQPDFPAVRYGKLIKVTKRAFFEWLEHGALEGPIDRKG